MPEILRADDDPEYAVARAASVLNSGGLVALPTETVYGLAARADDAAAVGRIFAAKGRPAHNPLIVHVPDLTAARAVAGHWPAAADRLAAAHWPGPLTLVVERGPAIVEAVTAGGASVALRAPDTRITRAILQRVGRPLAAPSANPSQRISPTTAEHVATGLGDAVDLIVDGGPCTVGLESAVVDLTTDPPRLLRPGTLHLDQLRRTLPTLIEAEPAPSAGTARRASPGLDRRHYAPRTRLVLAGRDELAAAAAALPRPLAAILCTPSAELAAEHRWVLGSDPPAYAAGLFAALHAADRSDCRAILVERPPDDVAWRAVHDRLGRAAEPA